MVRVFLVMEGMWGCESDSRRVESTIKRVCAFIHAVARNYTLNATSNIDGGTIQAWPVPFQLHPICCALVQLPVLCAVFREVVLLVQAPAYHFSDVKKHMPTVLKWLQQRNCRILVFCAGHLCIFVCNLDSLTVCSCKISSRGCCTSFLCDELRFNLVRFHRFGFLSFPFVFDSYQFVSAHFVALPFITFHLTLIYCISILFGLCHSLQFIPL